MLGPVGVGGFEEGEFERDSPTEKVAAQILLRGADAVQLPAQEIDEAAKIRIVVQHDPLGLHLSPAASRVQTSLITGAPEFVVVRRCFSSKRRAQVPRASGLQRRRGRVPGSDIIMSALIAICALAHGTRSLWKKLAGRLR